MTVFYSIGPRSCSQLPSSACASDQVRSARNGEESFKPGSGNENQCVMYRFLVTKELLGLAWLTANLYLAHESTPLEFDKSRA